MHIHMRGVRVVEKPPSTKKRERERIDFYSEQARKFNMNEKEKLAAAAAADVIALNHVMLDLWPTINSNKQVNVSFAS